MHSKYLNAGGAALNYLHSGPSTLPDAKPALERGELLVFLHDAGGNAGSWSNVATALAATHSVVVLDLPGHGRSCGTEGPATLDDCAEVVASFASCLELRPFVLVGKGMGASIALLYAMAHRREVRGLVLVGAAARVEVDDTALETWRLVTMGRIPQPFGDDEFATTTPFDVKREVWAQQVRTDPRVRHADLRAWRRCDLHERLHEVRQPVLVVSGAEDRIVPTHSSQELCPMLPNARMEIIEAAGHAVEQEQGEALAARIRDFVASIDLQEK